MNEEIKLISNMPASLISPIKDVKVREYIRPDCPKTHSTVVGDLQKCKLML